MCKGRTCLAPHAFPSASSLSGLANKAIITGVKRKAISKELCCMALPAHGQGVKCNGSTSSEKAMQPSFKIFSPMTEFQQLSCAPLDSKQWRLPKVNTTCSLQVFMNGCTRAPVLCGCQGIWQEETTHHICQSLVQEGNCNWTALWGPAERLQQQQRT